jgi:hypothetical protein
LPIIAEDPDSSIASHKDRKELIDYRREGLDVQNKQRNIIREELWQQKRLGSCALDASEQNNENLRRSALLNRSDMACDWGRHDFPIEDFNSKRSDPDLDTFMDDYTISMTPRFDRAERYQNSVALIQQTAPINSYAHKSLKTVTGLKK